MTRFSNNLIKITPIRIYCKPKRINRYVNLKINDYIHNKQNKNVKKFPKKYK